MNIHNELLGQIIGRKIYNTEILDIRPNYIRVYYNQERYLPLCEDINIYELSHKCCEWIRKQNV